MKTLSRSLVAILAVAFLAGCQAPKEAVAISDSLSTDALADLRIRASEAAAKDRLLLQGIADPKFAAKAEAYQQALFVGALESEDAQAAAELGAADTVKYLRALAVLRADTLAEAERLNGTSLGILADVEALEHSLAMKKAEAGIAAKTLADFKKTGVLDVILTVIEESELLSTPDMLLDAQGRANKLALQAKRDAEAAKLAGTAE